MEHVLCPNPCVLSCSSSKGFFIIYVHLLSTATNPVSATYFTLQAYELRLRKTGAGEPKDLFREPADTIACQHDSGLDPTTLMHCPQQVSARITKSLSIAWCDLDNTQHPMQWWTSSSGAWRLNKDSNGFESVRSGKCNYANQICIDNKRMTNNNRNR